MKSAKKILALILAGVMALALLTGCGKATSLNRTMAEGIADYFKSAFVQAGNKNNISVSYQVPELRRDIAPLFDENWIIQGNSGYDVLNKNHTVNGKTVEATLTDILRSYISADSAVAFLVTDVTDLKTPFAEAANLISSQIALRIVDDGDFNATSITSLKIEVTHKTVNGRTYALAVIIEK
jgi:ABC-type phosphate transport system ATPase subunit